MQGAGWGSKRSHSGHKNISPFSCGPVQEGRDKHLFHEGREVIQATHEER